MVRATLSNVARFSADIRSDGDKSSLLVALMTNYRGNDELRRPFFRSADTIRSAGDRSRVLMAVLGAAGDQRETLIEATPLIVSGDVALMVTVSTSPTSLAMTNSFPGRPAAEGRLIETAPAVFNPR